MLVGPVLVQTTVGVQAGVGGQTCLDLRQLGEEEDALALRLADRLHDPRRTYVTQMPYESTPEKPALRCRLLHYLRRYSTTEYPAARWPHRGPPHARGRARNRLPVVCALLP
jgi:hypothetical protein